MNLHKCTKLTPLQRQQMWEDYSQQQLPLAVLARQYGVSRPTVYKVLQRARRQEFSPRSSTNARFRCLRYGLRRLAKIERQVEERLKRQAKRYNKIYPGEMIHFDTKRLPLLTGEEATTTREYLFVAIDDFSRELFAAILPDKTQFSAARFLGQVIDECAYTIEYTYSDNGKEYKGKPDHAFVHLCAENGIGQRFTRVKTPRTNGKAERVIRTLMEMWHNKSIFRSRTHRQQELIRFVNFYNAVKPHKGIDGLTPHEKLTEYFYSTSIKSVNNA